MIKQKKFGQIGQETVTCFTLDNENGLCAEILNLGGILMSLTFSGTDVVLGRPSVDDYIGDTSYLGALIGRNSNRIEHCEFTLNGTKYTLAANDSGRNNNLHGGVNGFTSKIWDAKTVDSGEPQLTLTCSSPDGEEGFPGNVEVSVTYTLTKENSIKIHYEGTTDADTILNMTNHSYFNLNGHTSGDIKNHTLWLDCGFFTPGGDNCVPDGQVLCVTGTPFDFTTPKRVGRDMGDLYEQMQKFSGYDHNFAITGRGYRRFAQVTGDKTGIKMDCFTDLPAVQLYTGNYLNAQRPGKDGMAYAPYGGLCLETQAFPGAMSYSHYPSPILLKNEKYDTTTEYKFSK